MTDIRLTVVIPTRNRADLCLAAAESVIGQDLAADQVDVLVSDNSSSASERTWLADKLGERVRTVSPPTELPMTEHWEWATSEASLAGATHVTILTDRMFFRRDALSRLLSVVRSTPDSVISFGQDKVDDWDEHRARCIPWPGDGRVYEMESGTILAETAAGRPYLWPLPRMLNCVVPSALLRDLRVGGAAAFSSRSPDFYFGYRLLNRVSRFHCLNESLSVQRGMRRSNGHALVRGQMNTDAADYRRLTCFGDWATAFPGVDTIGNAIMHEYEVVRRNEGIGTMPPVDVEALRLLLAEDALGMHDPSHAASVLRQLGLGRPSVARRRFARRLGAALRHPGHVLGWRLPCRRIDVRHNLRQRMLPGGTFASTDDALAFSALPSEATIWRNPPPGYVRRR